MCRAIQRCVYNRRRPGDGGAEGAVLQDNLPEAQYDAAIQCLRRGVMEQYYKNRASASGSRYKEGTFAGAAGREYFSSNKTCNETETNTIQLVQHLSNDWSTMQQVQRSNMVSKRGTGRLSAAQGKGMEHPEAMITRWLKPLAATRSQQQEHTHTHTDTHTIAKHSTTTVAECESSSVGVKQKACSTPIGAFLQETSASRCP